MRRETSQLKNSPLKRLIPMIAKMNKKMLVTSIIFNSDGILEKMDSTTSLSPSLRLITLNGRSALNALILFIDFRVEPPTKQI